VSREAIPMLMHTSVGTITIIPDESIERGWFKLKQGNRVEMHPLDYREVLDELDKRDGSTPQ